MSSTLSRFQHIAILEQTPSILTRLTSTLPDATLDFRAGPDEWSIREILAHLVDDEMFVMRTRMERMMKEEVPTLPSHDEKKWYGQRNTSRDTINELLSDFATQRTASLGILTLLRDQEWVRTASHPEYGHFTALAWLGSWAEHDLVHIRQIEQTREAADQRV
jgi:DinB family protein